MAMGEAADRAAKLAIRNNVKPSQLEVNLIREQLVKTGAYLHKGEA